MWGTLAVYANYSYDTLVIFSNSSERETLWGITGHSDQ